jgi:hypothetical protein
VIWPSLRECRFFDTANYPGVAHEDILACLAYVRDVLSSATRSAPGIIDYLDAGAEAMALPPDADRRHKKPPR